MARFLFAPAAETDLEAILAWLNDRFGANARLRYEALIVQAIQDVAENPDRPGSRARPDLGREARTYHLAHSRLRVPRSAGRVKEPRHFLLYRAQADGQIEIGRILHDSMDLDRHLPDDYR
jgi:toxin ParE1/3/4